MSRALRKAQRRRLDLSDPTAVKEDLAAEESDELEVVTAAPNAFDLLNADGDDNDDVDSDTEGNTETLHSDEQEDLQQAIKDSLAINDDAPSKKKVKKKKKKSKQVKSSAAETEKESKSMGDDEDFDAILSAHQEAVAHIKAPEEESKVFRMSDILSINIKMLDPDVEMRKLFGSKVVDSERAERAASNRRNMPRGMQQQRNRGRKSILVPMDDNYPLIIKGGLEMTMLSDEDGIREFMFVHSRTYQETQYRFLQCVQSGDPQTMFNLLGAAPFHVDTLLQISEIVRHQGDNEKSVEFLMRALFAFDRAFHPLCNIASGNVRFPFRIPENRPFFLAIYRYIQSLDRRGCWSTALEFNKLLYALDPEEDPYAALLSIDYYAIKAEEWSYLQALGDAPWNDILDDDFSGPNFDYSQALAQRMTQSKGGDDKNAKELLSRAITKYPDITAALFDAIKSPGPIQYDNLKSETQFSMLLRDLYVFRSQELWKIPEMTKFLRDTALEVSKFETAAPERQIPLNLCRHILLLDERTLLQYLPKEVTADPGYSFDPLPPEQSTPSYMDAFIVRGSSQGDSSSRRLVPQFIQDLLMRIMPGDHPVNNPLNDEDVARMLEVMGDEDDDDAFDGANAVGGFDDPNGYGPNRGVDEPEEEGNAGRR